MQAYRRLFADPAFRRFWLALLLVMMADEIVRTTLLWHVHATTHSPEAVGLLMVCLTGPIIAGGLVAGWLLDHFPRARIMALDTGLRTVVVLAAAAALATGSFGLAPAYLLAAVQGALLMVLMAGAPAAIAELVPAEQRSAANALEMVGLSGASAFGPMLAGQLAAHVPVAVALSLAACCYAAFALTVRAMPIGGGRGGAAAAISWRASGVLHPTVVIITIMFLLVNVGSGALVTMLPGVIGAIPGAGAADFGFVIGLIGLGGAIGAVLGGAVRSTRRLPLAVIASQALAGLALAPIGLALASGSPSVAALAFWAFVSGFVSGPMTVWAQTVRMRLVAPQWRGRAFATLRMIMQSGRPVGGAAAGFALAAASPAACLLAVSVLFVVPALAALLHRAMRDPLA